MKNQNKRLYEGMYILSASLSEEALKKGLGRITNLIEGHGGEVHKVHDQGRKKLASQISGQKQGYYYLIYFSVVPSAIAEMWKEYHLNEDLLRFVTLKAEKVEEKIEFQPLAEV